MWAEEKLVEVVRGYMAGHLYHMTDEANLGSIDKHGLLSKDEAAARSVVPAFPGGSDLTRFLDDKHGLNDVVFLGFTRQGLMPAHKDERGRRPRLLQVNPEVLLMPGVRVALGAANHRNTDVYRVARAYYEMDWEVYFGEPDKADVGTPARIRSVLNYEVLIPKCVPPEFIIGAE